MQAHAQLRGRPRPVNDTWIAACCLVHDLPLATFNTKDFEDFAEHDFLAQYREAVEAARDPAGYARLRLVLPIGRLRVVA